jgi:hypothetical protein
MTQIEFRNERTHHQDQSDFNEDQLTLPTVFPIAREVHWLHGERKKVRTLLGNKLVTQIVTQDDMYFPK